jgi:tRNA threonylcarbamoyladenosine biosynthesis protein TsaE
MKTGRQPVHQAGFGGAEINAGNAEGGKAQFPAPATNPFFQSVSIMHSADDTCREYGLPDEAATLALGAALAQVVTPAAVIYLEGDLGAGKTTLVRGWLQKVGAGETAKSPTYTLVEPHVTSGLNLYHFDFYRFTIPEEFLDAGLDEYFAEHGICLVEWPDRAAPYLPAPDLRVQLSLDGTGRRVRIASSSERGRAWLSKLPARLAATSSSLPLPPA